MKVHEIMTASVRTVRPDTTLVEAAGLMREMDVGALPVCDGDELAGLVTDRDIVVRGVADGMNSTEAKVSEVMSGGVESVSVNDEVEQAAKIMETRQIRRLPVLNNERRLVGMVSLGDIATSSNPAFSGMALRDVSEPNNPSARRRRLARESEPARMPSVPGSRRGPSAGRRNETERSRGRSGGTSSRKTGAKRDSSSPARGRKTAAASRGGPKSGRSNSGKGKSNRR